MRIALCDDNPQDLARLETLAHAALRAHNIVAETCVFSHPEALFRAAERAPFDLYLLDVLMDMLTGIQLVNELKRFQRDPRVIFFSSSTEYAIDAFRMRAITYIEKPYSDETFREEMDRALEILKGDACHYLALGTEGYIRRFRTDEVEYVTTADAANYVRLHLADDTTIDTRASICSFAEEYKSRLPLVALGRRLLVNPAVVSTLDGKLVRFMSGHTLEIPRSAIRTLQDILLTQSAF